MYQLRKLLLPATLVAVLGFAGTLPAHAAPTFTLGNHPEPTEENIMLNNGTFDMELPSMVFGTTLDTGFPIAFCSTTDMLLEPSGGQARVEASDGLLNDITISIGSPFAPPVGFYTDLIINPK